MLDAAGMAKEEQDALLAAVLARHLEPDRLEARELALLGYADRLTLAPAKVGQADVAALRAVGLEDRAIHDACAIVAYFAFVNRLADGLGVEIEAK